MSTVMTAERILEVLRAPGRPWLSVKGLLEQLGGRRGDAREVRSLLRELEADARIECAGRRYRLSRADGLIEGIYSETPSGDGVVGEAAGARWQVPGSLGAQSGDRVLVAPIGARRDYRGEVVQIERGRRDTWIGVLDRGSRGAVVTPYPSGGAASGPDGDWSFHVAKRDCRGVRNGEVVAIEAQRPANVPRRDRQRRGRVVERIGRPGDPDADFRAVAWRHRLSVDFPPEVLAAAEALPTELDGEEITSRDDLRQLSWITIDPASARDHDDALCVRRGKGGAVTLCVAIADVAHWVREGSPLDREALNRGNSVYFPDRAIPMLPERLSGDLCSLRAGVDRLALVVEMSVDASGEVRHAVPKAAVVRIHSRLDYGTAAAAIEHRDSDAPVAPEVSDQLAQLAKIAERLRTRRMSEGSLDFDLPECELSLDAEGRPIDARRAARTVAHRMVEEAMLAANRAVARLLESAEIASVYRVHEEPEPDKLRQLRDLLESLDLLRAGAGPRGRLSLSTHELSAALAQATGRPGERLVHGVVVRAMKQARYGAENLGHYALAYDSYLHFTSPIRRYADLVAQRGLHEWLGRRPREAAPPPTPARMERMRRVAARVSARERIAVDAERAMESLAKCAVMSGHVGEEFTGRISGVARHGLYVTPDRYFVEGLVHISALPGFAELESSGWALVVRQSGARFALGDPVRVRVERVDRLKGWINFSLLSTRKGGYSSRSSSRAVSSSARRSQSR